MRRPETRGPASHASRWRPPPPTPRTAIADRLPLAACRSPVTVYAHVTAHVGQPRRVAIMGQGPRRRPRARRRSRRTDHARGPRVTARCPRWSWRRRAFVRVPSAKRPPAQRLAAVPRAGLPSGARLPGPSAPAACWAAPVESAPAYTVVVRARLQKESSVFAKSGRPVHWLTAMVHRWACRAK